MKPLFLLGTEAQPETYAATHDSCSGGRWVNVRGTEETLARVLLERFGLVEDQTGSGGGFGRPPNHVKRPPCRRVQTPQPPGPSRFCHQARPQSGLRIGDGPPALGT
jgi:hypothetical protein